MNKKVQEMLKNVVEENAVDFKKSMSNAIYEKVNNKLKQEYVNVAKKMFTEMAQTTNMAQGGADEPTAEMEADEAMVAQSPGGRSRGEGSPPPNPGPEPQPPTKPDREKEPWNKMTDDQFNKAMEEYEKAYQKWKRSYNRWVQMMEEYRAWQRRQRRRPS